MLNDGCLSDICEVRRLRLQWFGVHSFFFSRARWTAGQLLKDGLKQPQAVPPPELIQQSEGHGP